MDLTKVIALDIETYQNYLLVMFKKITTGQTLYFEKFNDSRLDYNSILNIFDKYTIVTFNGIKYDAPVLEAALAGFSNKLIYNTSLMIIEENMQPWQVRKQIGVPRVGFDHIDLIEVAPLKATLKIYAGRIHCKTMRDLPIPVTKIIKEEDLPVLREYCDIDLDDTIDLFKELESELDLRSSMSEEYKVDLRSKSDAQIAEAVIKKEVEDLVGKTPKRNRIKSGTQFNFKAPDFIQFNNPELKELLRQYTSLPFTVNSQGYVDFSFKITEEDRIKSGKNKGKLPDSKKKFKAVINNTKYTLGIGGIHSVEKSKAHIANKNEILKDIDVASYYPRCILSQRLYPDSIGTPFLKVYNNIVKRRLKAKKEGNKVVNESLKITINGSFGKFGSKWSILYAPHLMIQVTITGQLSLLMLIERMESENISVVSANTDGIVIKCDKDLESLADDIIEEWEFDTGFELEATNYEAIYSRDVNNYIAVKPAIDNKPKSTKGKGAYANQYEHYYRLRSNPNNEICKIAVKEFLMNKIPVEHTIKKCKDIKNFITIRTVNGWAIHHNKLLGKAIRWYYGKYELDIIRYSTNGNKVPKTDGAVPIMTLPKTIPDDIDYDWYITEANKILKEIGYKN